MIFKPYRLAALIFLLGSDTNAAGLMDCVLVKPECGRDLVGKHLWIVVPKANPNNVTLCPTPPPHDYKICKDVKTGSFLVKGVISAQYSKEFVASLSDGTTAYIATHDSIFLSATDPVEDAKQQAALLKARHEECVRRGQPKIGMTTDEAIATCWGRPRRVVKKTTAAGVEEDFVYDLGHILRFNENKLTGIVETQGH